MDNAVLRGLDRGRSRFAAMDEQMARQKQREDARNLDEAFRSYAGNTLTGPEHKPLLDTAGAGEFAVRLADGEKKAAERQRAQQMELEMSYASDRLAAGDVVTAAPIFSKYGLDISPEVQADINKQRLLGTALQHAKMFYDDDPEHGNAMVTAVMQGMPIEQAKSRFPPRPKLASPESGFITSEDGTRHHVVGTRARPVVGADGQPVRVRAGSQPAERTERLPVVLDDGRVANVRIRGYDADGRPQPLMIDDRMFFDIDGENLLADQDVTADRNAVRQQFGLPLLESAQTPQADPTNPPGTMFSRTIDSIFGAGDQTAVAEPSVTAPFDLPEGHSLTGEKTPEGYPIVIGPDGRRFAAVPE